MRSLRHSVVVLLAVAATALAACNGSSQPSTGIGSVTRLQGEGTLTRGSSSSPLAAEAAIQINDDIATGAGARTELTFADGTKLTVGEQSKIKIDTFVFDGKASGNKLGLNVTGPFRFVSGELSKGYGAQVSVTTPVATIGIRGTDFWGGPIDNQYGVFLIEGSVSVTTSAGEVVLTASGSGVSVPAPGQALGEITQWPQEKVDRAIATVTFQ